MLGSCCCISSDGDVLGFGSHSGSGAEAAVDGLYPVTSRLQALRWGGGQVDDKESEESPASQSSALVDSKPSLKTSAAELGKAAGAQARTASRVHRRARSTAKEVLNFGGKAQRVNAGPKKTDSARSHDESEDGVSPSASASGAMKVPRARSDNDVIGPLPPSARSWTSEEREQERARLQAMVSAFARDALEGCPCTCFAPLTKRDSNMPDGAAKVHLSVSSPDKCGWQHSVGYYNIDRSLTQLIVDTDQGWRISCQLSAIQDIFSFVEDGAIPFPEAVTSSLKPEELELLLLVLYTDSAGHSQQLCIMESVAEQRNRFLECMRVLCIFAQSEAPSVFS